METDEALRHAALANGSGIGQVGRLSCGGFPGPLATTVILVNLAVGIVSHRRGRFGFRFINR